MSSLYSDKRNNSMVCEREKVRDAVWAAEYFCLSDRLRKSYQSDSCNNSLLCKWLQVVSEIYHL